MTLDEIIDLFKRMEAGEEGQLIGYHIHKPISIVSYLSYGTDGEKRFSDFLQDLREHKKV